MEKGGGQSNPRPCRIRRFIAPESHLPIGSPCAVFYPMPERAGTPAPRSSQYCLYSTQVSSTGSTAKEGAGLGTTVPIAGRLAAGLRFELSRAGSKPACLTRGAPAEVDQGVGIEPT